MTEIDLVVTAFCPCQHCKELRLIGATEAARVGAILEEDEVAPDVIAAGASILWDYAFIDVSPSECEALAKRIYLAMRAKEGPLT